MYNNKSTALYKTPFSKAYWRDAAAELRDTRMLVFAALMIALRVALKMVYIPLAPNLKINTAFIANALGAMVFGPVMATCAAIISDLLGVLLSGEPYFPPFVLTEIAGSLIFALFLYRARLTPTRVMLSRFCICLFVNILLQTPLMMLYYRFYMGGAVYVLTVPHILKNLFMFPLETVVLTMFLALMQPITYRMHLTYNPEPSLRFEKKQLVMLGILFVFGCGCVAGYLGYHYEHTSLSASYTTAERVQKNTRMQDILVEQQVGDSDTPTVAIIESAKKQFLGKDITYTVAYYAVDADAYEASGGDLTELRKLKKSAAAKSEDLQRLGTAVIVCNEDTGEVISFDYKPE